MQFHLDENGNAKKCVAKEYNCPLGGPHFPNAAEARAYYENEKSAFQESGLRLSSFLDLSLLNQMVKNRYVYVSKHPLDDSLQLLCYSTRTQIEGKWNSATRLSRGLIIRASVSDFSDAEVVERPWEKFFTLSQMEDGWNLGDEESEINESFTLDLDSKVDVYDKMDGSLGILYRSPDGPAFATKGSFASEQAKSFTELLRNNSLLRESADNLLSKASDTTVLFELVGKNNRIVLDYEKTEPVLLGGNRKHDGVNVKPELLSKIWKGSVVERMQASTLREALAIEPRANREGVVVSVGGDNPMKIKIKQDDYLRIHRIVTMFSKKESRAVVMDLDKTTTYADLLAVAESHDVSYFPTIKSVLEVDGFSKGDEEFEFIREKRESYFRDILLPRAEEVKKAKDIVDNLDESYFTGDKPVKRFAAVVRDFGVDQSTLFALYKGRLDGKEMKDLSAFHEVRRAVQNVKDSSD